MLNVAPSELQNWPNGKIQILNQSVQVFVYEEMNQNDAKNRDENGTLKLLEKLPEEAPPTLAEMHAIRKEFIKKVFTFYILGE